MFSKACEYGIKAMIYLAQQSLLDRNSSLREIAMAIDSPTSFTAKILQSLARDRIVQANKGPNGGYLIDANHIETITLQEIVRAIDGDEIYQGCALGLEECSEMQPCPMHYRFKKIRDELKIMLETTTILQLSEGLNAGVSVLKRN
ncbi:MAG: Rrf2 family transcriptional regulator [Saprospiraceae bacterium]|nr:Rrf2 family transcriptional regulator [Saprospiraceae bacterium]